MDKSIKLSVSQTMTLIAFSKQVRALNYQTMRARYPRFGFRINTFESLERNGFLKKDRIGETIYRHSYKITDAGKIYLENDFAKASYFGTLMRAFNMRTEGADV